MLNEIEDLDRVFINCPIITIVWDFLERAFDLVNETFITLDIA